jgi:hypothetical protein
MVVNRALADAEIGGDVLAWWPASTRSNIWCGRLVRLATLVAAVSRNLDSAALSRV